MDRQVRYDKVLVPLDHNEDSEVAVQRALARTFPGGEIILLHVIPPGKPEKVGEHLVASSGQVEEKERAAALVYLREAAHRLIDGPVRWHPEVVIDQSVADGIVTMARRAEVGLVIMYHHPRHGLARLVRRDTCRQVQRHLPEEIELMIVQEEELAGIAKG